MYIRRTESKGQTYYRVVENRWIDGKPTQVNVVSLGTSPSIAGATKEKERRARLLRKATAQIRAWYPGAEALALAPLRQRKELESKEAALEKIEAEIATLRRISADVPPLVEKEDAPILVPTFEDYGDRYTIRGATVSAEVRRDELTWEFAAAKRSEAGESTSRHTYRPSAVIGSELALAQARLTRLESIAASMPPEYPSLYLADVLGSPVTKVRQCRYLFAYGNGFYYRVESGEIKIADAYREAVAHRRAALGRPPRGFALIA